MMSTPGKKLRIGEVARRLGMTPALLRAWETRYGIPTPERTEGGLRLYSEVELERLRAMRDLVAEGMAPAEAAELAQRAPATEGGSSVGLSGLAGELQERLEAFDDAGSQAVLDQLLSSFSAQVVVDDVILPTLAEAGARWATGDISVGQEHFATTLLRGRLLALARGWDRGGGPRAVLACPPGELHDLGLIAFGLALRTHGWRITYLGQDTPTETLLSTLRALSPDALVLASTMPRSLRRFAKELQEIPAPTRLFLGGRGAEGEELAAGQSLPLDPAEAARHVASAGAA